MINKEFNVPFLKYFTHVYQYGEIKQDSKVIILLHGGPGGNSSFLRPLIDLTKIGYTVITYDQLGSPRSSAIKGQYNLFKTETFVNELDNLISKLNIKKFTLLGHSWGGMLALEFISNKKPKNLEKLILFSSLSSARVWNESNKEIFLKLLKDHPKVKKHFLLAYQQADQVTINKIYKRYLRKYYRIKTNTSPYIRKKRRDGTGEEIYNYMWGKTDPIGLGTLKNWDVTPTLKMIKIPTLILYGKFDQSTTKVNELMHHEIKNSKLVYLDKSGHSGFYNEYPKAMKAITTFLKQN